VKLNKTLVAIPAEQAAHVIGGMNKAELTSDIFATSTMPPVK